MDALLREDLLQEWVYDFLQWEGDDQRVFCALQFFRQLLSRPLPVQRRGRSLEPQPLAHILTFDISAAREEPGGLLLDLVIKRDEKGRSDLCHCS